MFWVQSNYKVRASGEINANAERIEVNPPCDCELLDEWLRTYHDRKVIDYMKFGWPLNAFNTEKNTSTPPNQKGARSNIEQVKQYLINERSNRNVIGPFKVNPFKDEARFSPLDTRPKKDSDELRIILNLSHPRKGGSVNSSIKKDKFYGDDMTLKYPSVDNLAAIMVKKGKKCKIFKVDLKKAYRQLKMDPGCIHLVGFVVDNLFYFDVALSMG